MADPVFPPREADAPLPPLRRDIRIRRGPADPDGSPSWTLHDPPRHSFFRLQWLDWTILAHWGAGTVNGVVRSVKTNAGIDIGPDQVQRMAAFLRANELVPSLGAEEVEGLLARKRQRKRSLSTLLLHHYLFFRVPLVRPERFLRAFASQVELLFSPLFLWILVGAGGVGTLLTLRQWDSFATAFNYLTTAQGLVWLAVTLLTAKLVHEFGHAFAAHRYGCRVPSMGVAFMVMWPVLFTDTTDAWKLSSRRQRLVISSAGVIAELGLACIAILVWNITPDGAVRSAAALLASTSIATSLVLNLNPFMRFDGYYILSDLLGIDNLHPRAFAFGRWHLRECLFGWGRPAPEPMPANRRRFLIVFAYGVWIYRAVLFLGIAALVYHFAFKLLGITLAAVEIGWFLFRPAYREVREWWRSRRYMRWNLNLLASLAVIGGLFALSVIPWRSEVDAPGLLRSSHHSWLYPPSAARLVDMPVSRGQSIRSGDVVAVFESPDLDHRLAQLDARIRVLRGRIAQGAGSRSVLEDDIVLNQELSSARAEREGLARQRDQLTVRAPIDGIVATLPDGLIPGRWCAPTTELVQLVQPKPLIVEAFVSESDVPRLQADATGLFVPDNPLFPEIAVRISQIETTAVKHLTAAQLASPFGGRIAAREDAKGALVPTEAIYRVLLEPVDPDTEIRQVLSGKVTMAAVPESPTAWAFRSVVSAIIRESGF